MIGNVLAAVMPGLAVLALLAALAHLGRPGTPPGERPPVASFRVGPLWSWCPAEKSLMPHSADADGTRRCLSCKTITKERAHG